MAPGPSVDPAIRAVESRLESQGRRNDRKQQDRGEQEAKRVAFDVSIAVGMRSIHRFLVVRLNFWRHHFFRCSWDGCGDVERLAIGAKPAVDLGTRVVAIAGRSSGSWSLQSHSGKCNLVIIACGWAVVGCHRIDWLNHDDKGRRH